MTNVSLVPLWVEMVVALLLALSGLLAVTGAIGLVRLKDYFQRMHPVSLGTTFATWCTCAASIAYFSGLHSRPVIHAWLIPIFLCITVPITTILLARAALFRKRAVGEDVPPPLGQDPAGPQRAEDGSARGDAGTDLP